MASRPSIIPDMPIFGSDGVLVGTVHRVSGVRISLNRIGVVDTDVHYIPLAWVADVTDRVTLDCPAAQAMPGGVSADVAKPGRILGPAAWLAIAGTGIALAYGGTSLVLREKPEARRTAAPGTAVAPPAPRAIAAPLPVAAPAPVATPAGLLPASATNVAEFLNSDAPPPERFTLDTIDLGAGSAGLDAGSEKALRSIAAVMIDRPNTLIKLGIAPRGGAAAARRAAAIRIALIGLGVAEYRIATGPSRAPGGSGKSGVELIILRK
ncbi:MAG: DUF2171 domain-containing protein [Pseudomonadota bacterium]